ncbi:MAG TPA: ATP-binding protein [Candidatus Binatia bacterium]|nr:ATP-binding protein [Candidatus Binatia bacterium]
MGQTRVDLLHLLEDQRDAYAGSTEETIVVEIVANALDSGAARVSMTADPAAPALTILDDGAGMRRRELARYHDLATSTKTRGAGIGFAGVGIKLALLVCAEVVTETRRGRHHLASAWRLASRHKAPWRWIPPPGLGSGRGTAVRLTPTSSLSPRLDPGFIEATLRRHFQPLLDPALDDILSAPYPDGLSFVANGRPLARQGCPAALAPLAVEPAKEHASITAFLTRWGAALGRRRPGRRR